MYLNGDCSAVENLQQCCIVVSVFQPQNLPEVSAAERYFLISGENREKEREKEKKSEEMVKCKITVSEQKTRGGEETTAKSAFEKLPDHKEIERDRDRTSHKIDRGKIGAGGSGQVFRATYKNNAVVLKQMFSQLLEQTD